MTRDNAISRRTALKLTGAAAATALVAGCGDDDNGNGDEDETFEIDPGTEIVFYGDASYWEGKEPSEIDGVQNPTLVLQEGETYEIGWDEGDGAGHNIEIWDSDDALVEDYQTEIVEEPDDDQMLEFEVTDEMAYYVCDPHSGSMRGEIEIGEGNGGNGDDENGNGDDENGNGDDE
ncbi:plastocyanin/azurin family copper-binding protein [Natronorubrum tibetense]|uniref:Blue (Type 1) copper domain-containing protein n=1 Tax=Natronorubrum tibetense GA33 TaxID=1114856 RepID=L9VFQ5_9EURY|nr:plastocyanin/azurin family copper-binding protein [Natronorubrum tibetense]ELY35899.1 blue (type 1) copper domain-containing protein [Natronorubrum tibetense GA33]